MLAAPPAIASPPLDAQPTSPGPTTYRETVERGTTAFVARRFAEARQAFEEAFSIHPDPVLVFNIASCWRRDGHTAEALSEYRRFLNLAPSDDARRMLAEETIAALEVELEPPPAPVTHSEPPAPLRPARSIWRPIGLATTGVGTIGLIAGAVELLRARSLATDISTNDSTNDSSSRDGWDGQRDGGRDGGRDGSWDRGDNSTDSNGGTDGPNASETAKRRAILFGVSGAAVMAAGVTMYVIGRRSERALSITASAGSNGGQVVLGGRF